MIEIRPPREADLPALDRLFEASFGHGLEPATWAWKYRRLPGEARSLVAVDAAGAAVAHAGALGLPARWRGRRGTLWQLADFAGLARGRGLRPPLIETGRRLLADLPRDGDLPWIFGFPSRRHFRLGERVFGYRAVAEIVPLAGSLAAAAAAAAPTELSRWAQASHHVDLSAPARDWAAAAWEGCGVDGVERSAAFLNWRYHDRPGRYYRFYRLRSSDDRGGAGRDGPAGSGGLEGVAVFAFVGREAWAAELWLPPAGGWYDALSAVAHDLVAAGLETWRFWPPPPASGLAPLLARLGLVQAPGEALFLGCRGSGERPEAAASDVYYAMGDYDAT